jgi:hypothetical protein
MTGIGIHCTKAEDVPEREHWAIIESASVVIPGDERSRTNPGHGYPESTCYYTTYCAFLDKAAFETELRDRYARDPRAKLRAIHVAGVVKPRISIAFEDA